MSSHLVPRSPPSPTQSEYQSAIQFYHNVRDNNTLQEAEDIGGRPFILVDNVTHALMGHKSQNYSEHGQISRLLEVAYRRFQYQQPLQKSYQILDRLPIFYTLLDLDFGHEINKFFEDEISKLPIEISKLKELLPVKRYADLAERFYKQQWRWCAMRFEWKMSRRVHSHEHIVPITARTKIEPTRDGLLPKTDRKASLWVVEVPTSFVDRQIEQKLGLSDDDDDNHVDTGSEARYRFVVKRFSEGRKHEFENEQKIYNTIGEKEGIVQYIGWYTHCEKALNTGTETTYYNLVLELGDQDLYSAFQKENPPITFSEIQVFWKSMFNVADALASIQILRRGIYTTYLWHGDIKPENILDVKGRFKLADPGEARVKTVSVSYNGEAPKVQVLGGTRSFAAPEKFTYRPERVEEPEVTQGSDIWSLGCVFSVAATYVALGKEGVKQYRLLRLNAIESLGIGIGDPFHDKEKVLEAVTHWHKYLRNAIRKDDCYTAKILDLIDDRMLITPGEERISSTALSRELTSIDEKATPPINSFPLYIAEFIDNVTHSSKGSISELEDVPRTISNSGTELFMEKLLYPSRRSEGRPFSRLLQPSREDRLLGIGSGLDHSKVADIPERVSGFFTEAQCAMTALASGAQETPPKPPEDPPTTFWEVEADILEFHARNKNYVNHYFKKRHSVYGKSLGGKEDLLEKNLKNRDLVYLVDNASSMRSFWRHATYVLRVLVMRSLGYDDNGMELRFTNELDEKWRLSPKKKQSKEDFLKKMNDADPNKRKKEISKTDMSASLSLILEDHLRKNSDGDKLKRHLTILVLTDGLWEKNKEYDVDNYLITFIKKIPEEAWEPETPLEASTTSNRPPSRPRPISIQFVRFGHHPKAVIRLDRLDNHLRNRPELVGTSIPDIIDTEDANMDVYKMFLGSIIEDFDNKAIQGATVVSSTSGRSVTSPTSGLESNGMLGQYQRSQTLTPTSANAFSPFDANQPLSGSGTSHFSSNSLSQPYWSSRVPRMPGELSLNIPDQMSPANHRHSSGEYTAGSRGSGTYGQYTRSRAQSQGQQSKASSPLYRYPPSDDFRPG
ncbi:hypothetical protein F5Y01DRAFT_264959 [Xylaria sp. FL0043]|nr:hypothetical protein F5Y01DRAFT_264959 [Xylaria sp. FL0043]